MRRLTNMHLLAAALIAIAVPAGDLLANTRASGFVLGTIFVMFILAIVGFANGRLRKEGDSYLNQPISGFMENSLVNIVMLVWICVCTLIFGVGIFFGPFASRLFCGVLLAASLLGGMELSKRRARKNLFGFGLSFFVSVLFFAAFSRYFFPAAAHA